MVRQRHPRSKYRAYASDFIPDEPQPIIPFPGTPPPIKEDRGYNDPIDTDDEGDAQALAAAEDMVVTVVVVVVVSERVTRTISGGDADVVHKRPRNSRRPRGILLLLLVTVLETTCDASGLWCCGMGVAG